MVTRRGTGWLVVGASAFGSVFKVLSISGPDWATDSGWRCRIYSPSATLSNPSPTSTIGMFDLRCEPREGFSCIDG